MGDRVAFGKWLQKKRTEAGYTQSSAAQELGFVSKASVVGYENGISSVPIERIFHISKVYRIALSEILDRLKEYEPQIYEKYERLKNCFYESYTEEYFQNLSKEFRTMQAKGAGLHIQNYQDTGRRHHKPFLNEKGYLEVDRNIYYQTLIDLIEKALRGPPPEILFPGITDFAKFGPQIVAGPDNYTHQGNFRTPVLKRNNPCSFTRSVKAVQIHQGEAYNHDGDKGHEGILHRENQHYGITRPAPRYLLPDYQGSGKKLQTNPVDLDQGPVPTDKFIQGNLGEKPWTVLISKYFLSLLIIVFFISILPGCANTKFYICGIDIENIKDAHWGEMALGGVASIATHVAGHYLLAELAGVKIHQKETWEIVDNYNNCSKSDLCWFYRGGFLLQLAVNTALIEFVDTPASYFTEGFTVLTTIELYSYPIRHPDTGDINGLNNNGANAHLEYGIGLGWQAFNFYRISTAKEGDSK